jgi:hypothetical protein
MMAGVRIAVSIGTTPTAAISCNSIRPNALQQFKPQNC